MFDVIFFIDVVLIEVFCLHIHFLRVRVESIKSKKDFRGEKGVIENKIERSFDEVYAILN